MIFDPVISIIAKLTLLGLFALSGLVKIKDQNAFRDVLSNYGVHKSLLGLAALLVAVFELSIAVLIAASFFMMINLGMIMGVLLLGFYTGLLSFYYLTGRSIDCGCHFGATDSRIGPWHVVRNSMLLMVGACYFLPMGDRILIWLDYGSALFLGTVIGLALVIIENMINNNNHFKTVRKIT